MRDDMQQVVERLADVKVGDAHPRLGTGHHRGARRNDRRAAQAIKDLEKKKTPPGQSPPAGQPTDPPLVEKLAELKMIRSLQMRINRRTQRYGEMIEGEQAETPELLEALSRAGRAATAGLPGNRRFEPRPQRLRFPIGGRTWQNGGRLGGKRSQFSCDRGDEARKSMNLSVGVRFVGQIDGMSE